MFHRRSKANPQQSQDYESHVDIERGSNERLFGRVEVDIHVPDHLKEKFSEMCRSLRTRKSVAIILETS